MATYKVLQDIEAEDKLLGPLTLRQLIYAMIAALMGWLMFVVITKGAPALIGLFLPFFLLFGFFAFPWGRDQPTEVWALAKIRYYVLPRRRIWNQDGQKNLVTITVPKRVEHVYTDGLSQTEVKSRLEVLAATIDSRGWAIKNATNSYAAMPDSDRLVSPASLPQQVPTIDDRNARDMLDESDNPVAAQFSTMIDASAKARRQRVLDKLQNPDTSAPSPATAAPSNYWFLNQPQQAATSIPQDYVTFNTQVIEPQQNAAATYVPATTTPVAAADPTPDEEAFIRNLKNEPLLSANYKEHIRTIEPISEQQKHAAQASQQQDDTTSAPVTPITTNPASTDNSSQAKPTTPKTPVTAEPDAGILDLVRNNDLDVATIAREAHKRRSSPPDEVVISLH